MASPVVTEPPARPGDVRIGAQRGPQSQFTACKANIGIYGGGVFGGKTWALANIPLAHVEVPGFSCVTFRRTKPDIRNPGSLWDESMKWYPQAKGSPRENVLEWDFPAGSVIKFDGLQYDADALSWKSAQITLVQFDQLEEFTEYQFWYLLSRNRSSCGVTPYVRAGCNPMADTWLADLISWWWDQETGYAIPERSGVARWFIRVNDRLVWSTVACPCDAPEEAWALAELLAEEELDARAPGLGKYKRSLAFIRAALSDNAIGVAQDPDYEARVRAMPYVEQERLLGGNWKIRATAGLVFDRSKITFVDAPPVLVQARARGWDKAGTAGGGDWTAGVRGSLGRDGVVYIEDCLVGQWGAGDRENTIRTTAQTDVMLDKATRFGVEQEPGSGGKDSAILTVTNTLAGFDVRAVPSNRTTGNLVERAQPLAAQWGVGNVKLVRGPWNEAFLREAHAFPTDGVPDDRISAATVMYKLLTLPTADRPMNEPGSRSYYSR